MINKILQRFVILWFAVLMFFLQYPFIATGSSDVPSESTLFISMSNQAISAGTLAESKREPGSILDEISSLNKMADTLRENGKYDDAVQYYLEACNLIEQNEDLLPYLEYKKGRILCYLGLGFCYHYLEDDKTAADFLGRIDTNRTYWEWEVSDTIKMQYYSLSADIYLMLDETDKAEDCYIILNQLGMYKRSDAMNQFQQKKYREAIESAKKVIAEKPMHIQAYSYMAMAWKELGYLEEAAKVYDFLIDDHLRLLTELYVYKEIFPEALNTLYTLGKQYRDSGNIDRAFEIFLAGLDKVKTYESISEDYLAIYKEKSDLLFEYAYTYYVQGKYDEALQAFQALENHINPGRMNVGNSKGFSDVFGNLTSREAVDFYIYYAICLEKTGAPDKTRACYIEANKYYKKYPDGSFKEAETVFNEGRFANAIELFEKSLIKRPMNMEAYFYIAKAYYSLGEMDQAMKTIDFILSKDLVNPDPIRVFKSIMIQTGGDYKNAAQQGDSLPGSDLKKKLTLLSTLAFLSFIGKTLFTFIKKRKYKYSYALAQLYDEIEKMNAFNSITDETPVDTTGIDDRY